MKNSDQLLTQQTVSCPLLEKMTLWQIRAQWIFVTEVASIGCYLNSTINRGGKSK
jgi:hypothetical protein